MMTSLLMSSTVDSTGALAGCAETLIVSIGAGRCCVALVFLGMQPVVKPAQTDTSTSSARVSKDGIEDKIRMIKQP
jgi:hypothetical protein